MSAAPDPLAWREHPGWVRWAKVPPPMGLWCKDERHAPSDYDGGRHMREITHRDAKGRVTWVERIVVMDRICGICYPPAQLTADRAGKAKRAKGAAA